MELRQLEYFREIANTGSINEAARKLNMSQPPLSYQIRQLENELNVQLFERTHKGVILTAAGKGSRRRRSAQSCRLSQNFQRKIPT